MTNNGALADDAREYDCIHCYKPMTDDEVEFAFGYGARVHPECIPAYQDWLWMKWFGEPFPKSSENKEATQ